MRLTLTVLMPPEDNSEFMSELSCSADFKDPDTMSLEYLFKSNPNLKDKLEKHYNINLDLEYESNEIVLILTASDEGIDMLELFEEMRGALIKDLEVHGFEVITFATLFLDMKVPEDQRNTTINKELLN